MTGHPDSVYDEGFGAGRVGGSGGFFADGGAEGTGDGEGGLAVGAGGVGAEAAAAFGERSADDGPLSEALRAGHCEIAADAPEPAEVAIHEAMHLFEAVLAEGRGMLARGSGGLCGCCGSAGGGSRGNFAGGIAERGAATEALEPRLTAGLAHRESYEAPGLGFGGGTLGRLARVPRIFGRFCG